MFMQAKNLNLGNLWIPDLKIDEYSNLNPIKLKINYFLKMFGFSKIYPRAFVHICLVPSSYQFD